MAEGALLYYITDSNAFSGNDRARRIRLLDKISEAASAGVDHIQLREKHLSIPDLEVLAREAVQLIRNCNSLRTRNRELTTALLINSRTDVALAAEAEGVHLRASDVSPQEVRTIWRGAGALARETSPQDPLIAVSCHSPQEVAEAAANAASFAVFAPVFEKNNAPGFELEALREACRSQIPVLALGGVTLQNADSCLQAGAAGIAAIRLFQENNIAAIVRALRG